MTTDAYPIVQVCEPHENAGELVEAVAAVAGGAGWMFVCASEMCAAEAVAACGPNVAIAPLFGPECSEVPA